VHLVFAVYLLLLTTQEWWRSYEELVRQYGQVRQTISFYNYLCVVVVPVLLYLAATMLIPDETSGEVLNLQLHYHRVRVWFFGVLGLFHLVTVFDDALLVGAPLLSASNGLLTSGMVASAVLAATRRRWVHGALAVGMLAGQGAHIFFFSLRIPL
jgi:hypothetical protein